MAQVINISGYKFIPLEKLATLKVDLLKSLINLGVKGTILLSREGININLAGSPDAIVSAKAIFHADGRFSDILFKESASQFIPFSKMIIKIKKEVISMGISELKFPDKPKNVLAPRELKRWYDEGKPFTILDTRNAYEVKIGTFKNAKRLPLENFRQFPTTISQEVSKEEKERPLVIFCTGGIRCEKAMPFLQDQGFKHIYQLQGGILNYFKECGGAHYQGECFVFDDRIAIDANFQPTGTKLCRTCQMPVTYEEQVRTHFEKTQQCITCTTD